MPKIKATTKMRNGPKELYINIPELLCMHIATGGLQGQGQGGAKAVKKSKEKSTCTTPISVVTVN